MSSVQPLMKVVDLEVIDAFDRWALARGMRGRDIFDTISKVMRYWVSFAMSKVPRGDAGKIRSSLMELVNTYSNATRGAKTKAADRYRGTIAAAIVAILDYKGARELSKAKSPKFYTLVNRFVGARGYSANHHRSGFLPAISVLGRGKGAAAGAQAQDTVNQRVPKYRHPPGLVAHQLTDQLASVLVENFASQSGNHPWRTRPDGIQGLAGGAFDQALQEVIAMVGRFLEQDMLAAAAKAGFRTT